MDMRKIRDVYYAIKTFDLGGHGLGNLIEIHSILTVLEGLRPTAVVGFFWEEREASLRTLRDALVSFGVPTQISKHPWKRQSRHLQEFPSEVVEGFDRSDKASNEVEKGRLLWVFTEPEFRTEVRKAIAGQINVGPLLRYPSCCVAYEEGFSARETREFAKAIMQKVGATRDAVYQALRKNVAVELPDDAYADFNMARTEARFPFILHTACDTCLKSDDSPSSKLNKQYGSLAEKVHARFCEILSECSQISARIHEVIDDATRKGGKGFNPRNHPEFQALRAKIDSLYQNFSSSDRPAVGQG